MASGHVTLLDLITITANAKDDLGLIVEKNLFGFHKVACLHF